MMLNQYFQIFLPPIEAELSSVIDQANGPGLSDLHYMLSYAMGWVGPGAGPETRGKRIRPVLVLLTTAAAGGQWQVSIPAAAAVELIHNFSLIHDDIEDQSDQRRGRPTVWKQWNIAQATNAGDALFALAHLELLRLADSLPDSMVVWAAKLLSHTSLHLTQGQYLDLAYEQRQDLTEADYWPMIAGKTSALLAACTELGALGALASDEALQAYRQFGVSLGLAFQVQDDYLGIWGDSVLTGKSNASDLVTGKKTLPVLYGLSKRSAFYQRWIQGSISPAEAPSIATVLTEEGVKDFTLQQVDRLTNQAIAALVAAQPHGDAASALVELANLLLHRKS